MIERGVFSGKVDAPFGFDDFIMEQRLLTGIKEGERVATSNLADLYDGAPVTIGGDGP